MTPLVLASTNNRETQRPDHDARDPAFNQEDATRLLVLAVLVTEVTNDREPVMRLLRTMHPVSKAHCIKSYAGRIVSLLTFAFSLRTFSICRQLHLPRRLRP